MTVYGFVVGERLNLVMQDKILSICAVTHPTTRGRERKFTIVSPHSEYVEGDTHGVHLASLPLLLQGRDFDIA
jgi:hypothetical protein